ncbi:putative leader peptide [Actinomycetospora aeridis]|uniref:Leader peptide n=1 Tax=Actinomycetospora aeridis TaxID=3129231 RepID=A0ABU8NBV5_9PSEU
MPRRPAMTLVLLTVRRHVDLVRLASALCRS